MTYAETYSLRLKTLANKEITVEIYCRWSYCLCYFIKSFVLKLPQNSIKTF